MKLKVIFIFTLTTLISLALADKKMLNPRKLNKFSLRNLLKWING